VKLVVDTNTLISGALWRGASARLLSEAISGKAQIATILHILAYALGVGADAIVTADKNLLVLGSFEKIPIVAAPGALHLPGVIG
jgi:predicted nucleic acid-binding protein